MNFSRALLWDLTLSVFRITGEGTRKFLQGQTTGDFLSVTSTHEVQTCWLSPTGRLRALLEVKLVPQGAEFVILSGKEKDVINGLQRVIFPSDKVKIESCGEIRRVQKISFQESWQGTPFKWLSIDQSLPNDLKEFSLANDTELEIWRLHQGLPMFEREFNENTNPYELGLSNLINHTKGCYLGQETMSKLKNVGYTKQELRFFSSQVPVDIPEGLISKNIKNDMRNIAGKITSFLILDSGYLIGLALIRKDFLAKSLFLESSSLIGIDINIPIGFSKLKN